MNQNQDFLQQFELEVGVSLQQGVSLATYSNFRVGGPADYFFEATTPIQLKVAVSLARRMRVPYYLIGGGYNILFDDKGYRGLIIKNSISGMNLSLEEGYLEIFSGTRLGQLVSLAAKKGLAGLEFLAGIPGTVGGAIFGNAGAFGQSIGDLVKQVEVMDLDGQEMRLDRGALNFGYRSSSLKNRHLIVLKATLEIKPGSTAEIKKKVDSFLEKRAAKHPPAGTPCAGSYFKNPVLPDGQRIPAGYLLEKVGAKGLRVGQAGIFPGHCNFIVNLGQATAQEIRSLAAELKDRVRRQFNIELEEEVIFIPADASML
ncbi:MAG: UDP-N-acetylmuramate dehydrogenase [Candidatus Aminicenantes bacterium]|nr:UDP-N-acetylmuramate dehydrogenase [Candidatus Aminicenantes bacterium]